MTKRISKLSDLWVLALLPTADSQGVRLVTVGDSLRKRGIDVANTTVYSRLRTLRSRGLVDVYSGPRLSRSYTKDPVLYFVTVSGALELERLRERHREEHGDYPDVMTLPGDMDEPPVQPKNSGKAPLVDFISKYKIPSE